VVPVLRFIGLLNAAVWLGGMVFFTVVVGPTLFYNPEIQSLVSRMRIGAIAQVLIEQYMIGQQWCAGIALVHLMAEWLYFGRLNSKISLWILLGCLTISMLGAHVMVPEMKALHLRMYAPQKNAEEQAAAKRSFGILHGTSQVTNLLALCGVLFYYWRLSYGNQGGKTGSGARFR
jgi:hypothetical protein